MGNKASFSKSIFQISVSSVNVSSCNEFPRISKSRRHLLYNWLCPSRKYLNHKTRGLFHLKSSTIYFSVFKEHASLTYLALFFISLFLFTLTLPFFSLFLSFYFILPFLSCLSSVAHSFFFFFFLFVLSSFILFHSQMSSG